MSKNSGFNKDGNDMILHPAPVSKHLWMINHSASAPHKTGGGGRHYSIAKSLPEYGWSATIFGSTTVHANGKQAFKKFKPIRRYRENGVDCVWVWSNSYASGGIARVLGMIVFALALLVPGTTKRSQAPDAILGSTVHLLAAWSAYLLSKRYRVPFIFEIRDVWPETLIDLGAIKEQHPVARMMKKLSLFLAARAELVVSPLPGVSRYLSENNLTTPFLWVSNGTEASLKSDTGLSSTDANDEFTFMYMGSLGRANAVDTLLYAFDAACEQIDDSEVVFRLVGSGPLKEQLEQEAGRLKHGDKIRFENRIPRSQVIGRAMESDCLVANLRDRSIYRYGVSLNKLYDYMLASRPIVIGINAYNDPVMEASAGLSVAADQVNEIASAMVNIFEMGEDERSKLGRNGRDYVLNHFSYQQLASTLANSLDKIA
ncbi:MAG: glycosyltransferase family 4 protein [Corynebacterium glutamicum]|nr:glycosyltransferase family 4 protein [Corynebacterium glutamicum]